MYFVPEKLCKKWLQEVMNRAFALEAEGWGLKGSNLSYNI